MLMHKIVTTGCIAVLLWKLENWFLSVCTHIRIGGHTRPDSTTKKTWTHTENLRVFETALGQHLQSLTVSKTAFDKLLPLKWSNGQFCCVCMCVCVCVRVWHHVRLLLLRFVSISSAVLYDVVCSWIVVTPVLWVTLVESWRNVSQERIFDFV